MLKAIETYFWDIKKGTLDPKEQKKEIIIRTLNYGNLATWAWIAKEYGKGEILAIINSPRNGIRIESKQLANIFFHD